MSTTNDPSGYATLTPEQKAEVDACLPERRALTDREKDVLRDCPTWNVPPPYDELLEARVKQLKEIDEELELLERYRNAGDFLALHSGLKATRRNLQHMIQTAEHEAARF